MAAVIHGCGSPRQHHISSTGRCLASSNQQHHTIATPMYPTMPKYNRSPGQPLISASTHHHSYDGSNSNLAYAQYNNTSLPLTSYISGGSSMSQQQAYSSTHSNRGTTATNYWDQSNTTTSLMYRSGRHHSKRRSAVELLAETKPLYIKPETFSDRLQQQPQIYRSATLNCNTKRGRNGNLDSRDDVRCTSTFCEPNHVADIERRLPYTSNHMHQNSNSSRNSQLRHHHHHSHVSRHNAISAMTNRYNADVPRERDRMLGGSRSGAYYRNDSLPHYDFTPKSNSKSNRKDFSSISFANDGDPGMVSLPPPSFLSLQSFDNEYTPYDIESTNIDEPLVLTENYRPISPPAEYRTKTEQRSRYNYQRSYSHSNEIAAEKASYAAADYNINSHKSLPDLHSSISRHSPHSEILSCCSRGNRSIKSAGESSLNRDSGGSSGHYTHRSEPCYRQREIDRDLYGGKNCCQPVTQMEIRRDSGSSTQHSANSYGGYISPAYARPIDCIECRCKNGTPNESSDYTFNFTTPEVPEAFQDDYNTPTSTLLKMKNNDSQNYNVICQQLLGSQTYSSGALKQSTQNHMHVQSPGSAPSVEDISPPPIQFKRQRCIRFKNRNRISLPSAPLQTTAVNDVAENYHKFAPQNYFSAKTPATDYPKAEITELLPETKFSVGISRDSDYDRVIADLENFFDRLGLNDDKFHEIYCPPKRRHSAESDSDNSSTVFFSDVSTVDSMRLPDSTETQTQTIQPYRPSEPLSIVERNARIIKWMCNCHKMQNT